MEILRNTPGSRQNALKLTQLLADPGATSLRDVRQAHRKWLHRSNSRGKDVGLLHSPKEPNTHDRTLKHGHFKRQSDQRTVVAVLL